MISHTDIADDELFQLMRTGAVALAGNRKLKIFGTLRCRSGKRMKRINRVFFQTMKEAFDAGYRPCKQCRPETSIH